MASMAAAVAATGRKGGKLSGPSGLKYRAPMTIFFLTTPLMLLLSVLGFLSTPDPSDSTQLQVPQMIEDIKAIPFATRGFSVQLYVFSLVQALYSFAISLGMNFTTVQYICKFAWGAHALEALYALWLCVKNRASLLTTIVYVVMVFLGGYPQLGPLKSAIRALHKVSKQQ